MRLIIIGCEFTGETTLTYGIRQRIVLDTSASTVEQTLAEFVQWIRPLLGQGGD